MPKVKIGTATQRRGTGRRDNAAMRVQLTNRLNPMARHARAGELPGAWVNNVGKEVHLTMEDGKDGKVVGRARVLSVRQSGAEVTIEISMDDDSDLAKAIRGKVWPGLSIAPATELLAVASWESERIEDYPDERW